MSDLDLRKVRYFLALAETLHYGRAAARLHIAQPVLSRQIRALEDELKAQLFVRDRRGVTLTDAGSALLADAPGLLASASATRRHIARAARGTETFTIAFMPGLIVTPAAAALQSRHPALRVEVIRTGWEDQEQVLRDGRADVSYVRLPVDERGLHVLPLSSEPRVAVLASTHRLADKDALTLADLADETLVQNPDAVPEWRARTPQAKPQPPYSVEEKLEHIALARGIAVLPASVVTFYTRPDIRAIPLTDLAPTTVALAWVPTHPNPLIPEFAEIAALG